MTTSPPLPPSPPSLPARDLVPAASHRLDPLRLFLIRHAKADKGSISGHDADRPLTTRGLRQACHLADALVSLEPRPVRIVSSAALRAISTAGVLQTALACPLDTSPSLAPSRGCDEALELLLRLRSLPCVALVGHNPQLSELASLLLARAPEHADLRTGQCLVLDVNFDAPAALYPSGVLVASYRLGDPAPKPTRKKKPPTSSPPAP